MGSEEIEIKFKNGEKINYYRCTDVSITNEWIKFITHNKFGTAFEQYIPTENIVRLQKWAFKEKEKKTPPPVDEDLTTTIN